MLMTPGLNIPEKKKDGAAPLKERSELEDEIYKKNNTDVQRFFSSLTGIKEKFTVFWGVFLFCFFSLTNKLTVVHAYLLLRRSTLLANTHHLHEPTQAYLDAKLTTAQR